MAAEILSETPINIHQLKEELGKIKKRDTLKRENLLERKEEEIYVSSLLKPKMVVKTRFNSSWSFPQVPHNLKN